MQKSVRTPTDYCFARCAQLREYVSQKVWALFLLRYVSTKLCCWVSFIILLLDAFWFKPRRIEIKPRCQCAGGQPASPTGTNSKGSSLSMLELLRVPSHSDWSEGFAHPPAAAWLCKWLQLFRLETGCTESPTIVELGTEGLYCA